MSPIHDPRDVEIRTTVGQIDVLGVFVLTVMNRYYPEHVKAARLAFMAKISDARKTLFPVLDTLETFGYATHTGEPGHESWAITDYGRSTLRTLIASPAASTLALPSASQPALPMTVSAAAANAGENLSAPDLYSIDLDRSKINDRSMIEDANGPEKISDRLQEVAAWCQRRGLTGDKRDRVLRDPWCTADRLEGWLQYWTREGQTAAGEKFRSKWGPLNYAIACCLNKQRTDPPAPEPAEAEEMAEAEDREKISESIQPPVIDDLHSQYWQAALGELQMEMTRATFETWVKPCRPWSVNDGHWTLAVRDRYAQDWLQRRIYSTVRRILSGITSRDVTIDFIVVRDGA